MKCATCSGPMTPMLYSWFCPKDCDRPKERKSRETVPGIGGPLQLLTPSIVSGHIEQSWSETRLVHVANAMGLPAQTSNIVPPLGPEVQHQWWLLRMDAMSMLRAAGLG